MSVVNDEAPCVLIVEDEKLIRRFVRSSLEEEGCQVVEAGTSAQGLLESASRRPDLVILDLGLPDGNGVDFIRDQRGWSDVPVLVLSARSNEKDKIQALDAGADDYLTKPFAASASCARGHAPCCDGRAEAVVRRRRSSVSATRRSTCRGASSRAAANSYT